MNAYLDRLRHKNSKTGHPDQPPKPSKPSFEGFEGEAGRHILKNCLQCGEPIGPGSREVVVRSTANGQLAPCHQDCLHEWLRRGPLQ
jgi:hypothetical protein